ncbi:hypothetical protein ACFQFC_21155 [Amorphoplanes digitatis]|uniref:Pyruvate/2-oxoglutarate dehydrogenase complex dihydrolipoamide acyltransferase (E2) component n=1 Tax=Actinoplanes digitatis TaxID=1868 RepID=A0A7W7I5J2_9ACTN|nr:hypothetical protein [Actinoplanes digitatis]MBB4766724.1 pyruvate/2-oxoglutarate dehydrogenase complex dihydrolipoamide acyltransferase (E2) component [Actinoplanes digitatis]BFE76875.1 hypothetical protein GCM10020092_101760 [Actinoplanes digitatis]GID96670.1 hypothetical protein Adi01nite_60820 [Actinoplanes digitatis]
MPVVASLLLAALLGAPTAAGPAVDPRPAPVAAASAASVAVTRATEPVAAEPSAPPAPPAPADVTPAAAAPGVRTLADQSGTAATGPRAPPLSA